MKKTKSLRKKVSKYRVLLKFIYAILIVGISWQIWGLVKEFTYVPEIADVRKIDVYVGGNVEHPGKYRVAEGTTTFEILRVAGLRSNSDITPFNLSEQVDSNSTIDVGKRSGNVALAPTSRLEFFYGDLKIFDTKGNSKIPKDGIGINNGDRLVSGDKTQVEVSLNAFSRLDMDNYSEVVFDNIAKSNSKNDTTQLFQKSGYCWYRVVYANNSEKLRIVTPLGKILVAGKGAELNVEVKLTEVTIDVNDGLALIKRDKTGEVLNAVGGQRIIIYDDNRPFKVSKILQEKSNKQRFDGLGQVETDRIVKNLPLNFIFCTIPNAYHLISVRFDQHKIYAIRIPANTNVSEFAQGFRTFQEAFLYGGTVYATTIAERILDIRVPKYVVFDKDDMVRSATIIGGVNVKIDSKTMSGIGASSGSGIKTLSGQQLIDFMKPKNTGSSFETERRQMIVLKALFEGLKSRTVVLTAMKVSQVVAGLESNMSTAEIMEHYKAFMVNPNSWRFVSLSLPTKKTFTGRKTIEEPILEKCRLLLNNN